MDALILSKYLIIGDGTVKKDWGVKISGSIIADVDANDILRTRYPNDKIYNYEDKILSPGFVNAHMHFYGILAHGITTPVQLNGFEDFLNDFWWPCVENRLTHELIQKATRMSGLELLNSGVTTVCDILEAPFALPNALDAEALVIKELGLRAILSFEACERINSQNAREGVEENLKFYMKYKDDQLISGMGSFHTTFTCSEEFIKENIDLFRRAEAGMQFHLSESSYESQYCLNKYGARPVELYKKWGVLGNDILVSQVVKVTEHELNLLAEYGVRVAHLPLSNCEVGGGVAPVPEMLERNIAVGLGTDGYINNFFEVMRGAFLIHKANKENPSIMPAHLVFEMATKKGAEAVGIKGIGEIKEGYFADLITIKIDAPTPVNENNIYDQLILYHNPWNVSEVIVHGKMLKEEGKIIGYNLDLVKGEARNAARQLWGEGDE